MIVIGCAVYLSVGSVAGAVLFSIALLIVCLRGYGLYTGRIGFIAVGEGTVIEKIILAAVILAINLLAAFAVGSLLNLCGGDLVANAKELCANKLSMRPYEWFIKGLFCGFIMYIAVAAFYENKSVLGVLFGVPVFILAGFEHSIADFAYLSIAGMLNAQHVFLFMLLVILGNTMGSIFISLGEEIVREIYFTDGSSKEE